MNEIFVLSPCLTAYMTTSLHLSLSLSLSLFFFFSFALALSLSLSHSLTFSLSPALSLFPALLHSLALSLSRSRAFVSNLLLNNETRTVHAFDASELNLAKIRNIPMSLFDNTSHKSLISQNCWRGSFTDKPYRLCCPNYFMCNSFVVLRNKSFVVKKTLFEVYSSCMG